MFLLLIAVHAVAQAPAQPAVAAPPQQTKQQQQPTPSPPAPIPALNQQPQPATYQPDCTRPADHDEADYCAQWAMADAAKQQLELIWWQNLITGAEVAGLLVVIVLTLITIWQTRIYTRQELRAYVHLSDGIESPILNLAHPVLKLKIRNSGQTPAFDVLSRSNFIVAGDPLIAPLPALAKDDGKGSKLVLFPGMTSSVEFRPAKEVSEYDRAAAALGIEYKWYLYGCISYRDAFGKSRKTLFRYILRKSEGGADMVVTHCREDNDAT